MCSAAPHARALIALPVPASNGREDLFHPSPAAKLVTVSDIRQGLEQAYGSPLTRALLDAHSASKTAFYAGGARLAEVEAGRFCEAAFRMIEIEIAGSATDLGRQLDTQAIIRRAEAATTCAEAIRLHIPRSLRLIYDIRNRRNAAHLADGIDPSLQDASLVMATMDWILAEFVRLHHAIPTGDAYDFVRDLVTRRAPFVQDFDGFPKVLRPELEASEYVVLLLYERGIGGATSSQIAAWVRPRMKKNLGRTLGRLVNDLAWVHADGKRFFITQLGQRVVEERLVSI